MRTDDFDFELPAELIAQVPAPEREDARLFVHDTLAGRTTHATVRDLPDFLRAGDLLVFNDTRVRPVRLFGRRASGGVVEFLLVERLPVERRGGEPGRWRALAHPARRLKPGERVELSGEDCGLVMIERLRLASGELDGAWVVRFDSPTGESDDTWIERLGRMPLPPYIRRPRAVAERERRSGRSADDSRSQSDANDAADAGEAARPLASADPFDALDRERYQTVYANEPGAVAAPTAGLHFTPELIARLAERGVESCFVTLHVGEGTFQPVKVRELSEHRMHSERYRLGEDTVAAIERTRARGGRVVAVGTTSVRVLESCADENGALRAGEGSTDIFLHPGREFRVVDVLFTNFHLPKSTLLMLVSAFAGRERTLALYAEAVEHAYRFFSYGDAMLISHALGRELLDG